MRLDRRRFLAASAAAAAGAGCGVRELIREDDLLAALTGVGAGDPAFKRIGRRYLRGHPDEATESLLLAALGLRREAGGELSKAEVLDVLFAAIARDVAEDDLVVIRRWVFTRTEARLFALGSLPL